MQVVIIEDEHAALSNLKELINNCVPEVKVLAELDSIQKTVVWFSNKEHPKPDLLFMDIHLSDGNAFEIFKAVDIISPVIFTTAYDEYALKAFEVNSIDYLLKPINEKKLKQAIHKFRGLTRKDALQDLSGLMKYIEKARPGYKSHLLIPHNDNLIPVSTAEIAYIYIEHGIVRLLTHQCENYTLNGKLEEFQEALNPWEFFRLNRQIITSKKAVKSIGTWFNQRLSVTLQPGFSEKVIVSKEKAELFKQWFTS